VSSNFLHRVRRGATESHGVFLCGSPFLRALCVEFLYTEYSEGSQSYTESLRVTLPFFMLDAKLLTT